MGFEHHGIKLDSYNDPTLAVSEFTAGKYDLVLLDIKMPQMNGFQVYRELKKVDDNIDIWFFTAFEVYQEEFRKIFPEVKVQTFLKKPISISDLVAQVKQHMASRESARLEALEA